MILGGFQGILTSAMFLEKWLFPKFTKYLEIRCTGNGTVGSNPTRCANLRRKCSTCVGKLSTFLLSFSCFCWGDGVFFAAVRTTTIELPCHGAVLCSLYLKFLRNPQFFHVKSEFSANIRFCRANKANFSFDLFAPH